MSTAPDELRESRGLSNRFAKKLLVQLTAFLSLAIVCLALWVVYHTLQDIQPSDVLEQFRALSFSSVLLAFLLAAAAYFVVTGYDVLALNHIDRPLPYRRAAFAACLANAFGTNLGFAVVTGGAVRYRIYSRAGLSALEIAGVTTMCALTATLGIGSLLTLALLFATGEVADSAIHLPVAIRRTLGGLMLAFMAVYITVAIFRPLSIRTESWSLRLPSATTAAAQILLGAFDLMLIGSIIYVLLPAHPDMSFPSFLGVFAFAMIAGVISHVPGGIGVFESVMLLGLPHVPPAALLSAILLFRCIYYLAPLGLAAVALAVHEASLQRARFEQVHDTATDWLAELGPQVMALIVIFAGVVLFFSGAVPAPPDRLALLQNHVPLPVLEASHVLGGAAGLGLIILARGLSLRLHAAYQLAAGLLGIAVTALLLKGLIYEGAIFLGFILAVLLSTRSEFPREGSLLDQGYPTEWSSTLLAMLALTVWLGLWSYKATDYSHELWWHFDYTAELPRFLRTTAVVFFLAGGIALINLLRPDPIPDRPQTTGLDQARRIVRKDPNSRANLALLGDKRFLFSDAGNAFIMYRVKGKSWVALGDPVGPGREHSKLVFMFRELCDRYGGWPVFYQVDSAYLPLYVDLGLSLLKLGDDARVPLETFTLRGSDRAELRRGHDRVFAEGVNFAIVKSADVPPLIPELKRVSDDWLSHTRQPERGFSRGFFDPAYVANFPCAVVRKDDRIIAFAVLWISANKEELALDLMRYQRDAPEGIVRFMVMELMLGGRTRGYRWFNLGLVPLTGLERHALAPLWQRVGRILYRQSEHFRDSDSYRQFAEQLEPLWSPKYLASPGGFKTARILRDIASLVARPE
ncbi:MAG: bifunctional lysylphosphatidylglycerol flippase/synthetase MprF [Chromatiales bacterium]